MLDIAVHFRDTQIICIRMQIMQIIHVDADNADNGDTDADISGSNPRCYDEMGGDTAVLPRLTSCLARSNFISF